MSDAPGGILDRLRHYATARQMRLEQRLGFGRDGEVFATSAATAVKGHSQRETYERELTCYQRLRRFSVGQILGHHVPQLLDWDHQLMVIEMTIVTRPFLLDFASAYLDTAPDFPDDAMEYWRDQKRDQFGDRWPDVEPVLARLRSQLGIHLLDINPGNITFPPLEE